MPSRATWPLAGCLGILSLPLQLGLANERPVRDERQHHRPLLQLGGPVSAPSAMAPGSYYPQGTAHTLLPKSCTELEKRPPTRLSPRFQVCRCHLLPTGTMTDTSAVRWKSPLCHLGKHFWLLQLCIQNALPWPESRGLTKSELKSGPSPNTGLVPVEE